ncbi:MAG TPA: CGNR zinc finger domain-containing protein [Acidimicrobiales bacterium]|nr:CGNR zinc finger domain-containing protein [Acidimicrobiales bacterium]
MQYNHYGGGAAEVAAALVNHGADLDPSTLEGLLRIRDYQPRSGFTDEDVDALRSWTQRLRSVFEATSVDTQVELVNDLLADAAARPHVAAHDGRPPHLHYVSLSAGMVEQLAAYTAAGVALLVCQDPGRLGACERPGCDSVFVDTSRSGMRRYCTVRCANRVRVADHRQRFRRGAQRS